MMATQPNHKGAMKVQLVEDVEPELQDVMLFVQEDYTLQLGIVGLFVCGFALIYLVYCVPKNKLF